MFNFALKAAGIAAVAFLAAVPSQALTITYSQFTQDDSTKLLQYTPGATSSFSATDVPVRFSVFEFGPVGVYDDVLFSFHASSSQPVGWFGPVALQYGYDGGLSFTGTGGLNYLSISFTNAAFGTVQGGSAGAFVASPPAGTLTVTSDVLDVSRFVTSDFSLAFSGFSRPFDPDRTFRANVSGTFAGAVPEPASWAMMITGFGLVGMVSRRRRPAARSAIA